MTTAQLGASGIVLNETDEYGVMWSLQEGSDLFGPSPQPREITGSLDGSHGSWDATEHYESRSWAIEGFAYAPDHETLHQARTRFERAVGARPFQVRGVEPGFDRVATFRRSGTALFTEIAETQARFSAQVFGADPCIYSTEEVTATASFPVTAGGRRWPARWPGRWSASTSSDSMTLTNVGTETAWPVFRIDGPIVSPTIVNATTGEVMRLALTLGAGEWLTVDTGTHQVLANGDPTAGRRGAWRGSWFGLEPGIPTVIRLGGVSAGPGAQLRGTFHHTWI